MRRNRLTRGSRARDYFCPKRKKERREEKGLTRQYSCCRWRSEGNPKQERKKWGLDVLCMSTLSKTKV